MKLPQMFLAGALLLAPFFLAAQSPVGDWQWEQTGPDGAKMASTMSIKADGTYAIDFQSDGTPEVMGIYRYEEGNMIIKDTSEGPCKGLEAIYAMKVDENSATATMVEDPCPARAEGNSEGAMNLKRKE